jgi:D-beta-D-heptose 7-phosphate kinase/D-beta-D-heptose 1-phosphate adenosyltransferase
MLERLPVVSDARIVVVGDAMLDIYTWGEVSRISPEAPVPVVSLVGETATPGGAANAAVCIAALGAKPELVAKVGHDINGDKLARLLIDQNVLLHPLSGSDEPTTTKNRIWSSGQQLLRLDVEQPSDAGADCDALADVTDVSSAGAVLVSDYGKGVVNDESAAWLVAECQRTQTPLIVDPKFRDFSRFRGCTVIKPNEREAADAFEARYGRVGTVAEIGKFLTTEIAELAVVTLGAHGIALFGDGDARRLEPRARTVYDVTGAGDIVAAVLAVGIASGWTMDDACEVANMAAGVCVSRVGTGGVTMEEIEAYHRELMQDADRDRPDHDPNPNQRDRSSDGP